MPELQQSSPRATNDRPMQSLARMKPAIGLSELASYFHVSAPASAHLVLSIRRKFATWSALATIFEKMRVEGDFGFRNLTKAVGILKSHLEMERGSLILAQHVESSEMRHAK